MRVMPSFSIPTSVPWTHRRADTETDDEAPAATPADVADDGVPDLPIDEVHLP